ncbi:hypothetical protein WJX84_006156 [Apatococcus fuscideae]|uniref:Uncharacterized protein n=1 Tax=Apatococcus fuscideae TaxID=2026836 RepID=A0AAW1SXP2_9CHLO
MHQQAALKLGLLSRLTGQTQRDACQRRIALAHIMEIYRPAPCIQETALGTPWTAAIARKITKSGLGPGWMDME